MAVRASKRPHKTSKRRTVAVAPPSTRHGRNGRAHQHLRVEVKPHHGPSPYTKALRFLATLSDYERMRIVRYTSQNFDLDRMRTLLRKLGNPQDKFRTVH